MKASHTKDTYLAAQYHRLATRRGKKRALVALGHTLLVIMYHLLKNGTSYQELGADFLERLEPDRLTRQLVKRLEKLGHNVILQPKDGHPATGPSPPTLHEAETDNPSREVQLERSAGSRSDSARQQHRLSQDYRYIIPQSALGGQTRSGFPPRWPGPPSAAGQDSRQP